MTRLADWGFVFGGYFPAGFQRRLLDLAAARYVVVAPREDRTSTIPGLGAPPAPDQPRRRACLQEPDGAAARRLGADDRGRRPTPRCSSTGWRPAPTILRQVALVEEPAPAFRGEAGEPATGTVDFETDDPEHVVLRVHAPRRGFLVLADQWFPGWRATVDGTSVPIVRANYVFRLVEVPAGDSVVDFRYRPRSVALGALVSALSIAGVVGLLIRTPPGLSAAAARRRRGVEVARLVDDEVRPGAGGVERAPDVLAEDAERDQLHAGEHHEGGHQRRPAGRRPRRCVSLRTTISSRRRAKPTRPDRARRATDMARTGAYENATTESTSSLRRLANVQRLRPKRPARGGRTPTSREAEAGPQHEPGQRRVASRSEPVIWRDDAAVDQEAVEAAARHVREGERAA